MRYLRLIALTAAITACVPASEVSRPPTVSFDSAGRTKDEVPALRPGDNLYFNSLLSKTGQTCSLVC